MTTYSVSSTAADDFLKWLTTATTMPTAPAAQDFGLFVGDPGSSGTSNVSVGSTTRVAATFTETGGVSTMSNTPGWTNGGTSETLTAIGSFGATSGGTFWFDFPLSSSQAWASGNTFTLTSMTLTIPEAS
jgi:hypothetical protein